MWLKFVLGYEIESLIQSKWLELSIFTFTFENSFRIKIYLQLPININSSSSWNYYFNLIKLLRIIVLREIKNIQNQK